MIIWDQNYKALHDDTSPASLTSPKSVSDEKCSQVWPSMQTVSNRQNTNRDCCLHSRSLSTSEPDWTLYSLFKGTAQIITHLHFEQGGEDKRDRDRNRKSGRGNVLLENSFIVYSYWSVYMYLHVLYCCHQKYRDVGKPFLKGLFFLSKLSTAFDLPFDVSMPEGWCYLLLCIRGPVQPIYLGLCIIAEGHFMGAHFCCYIFIFYIYIYI